MPHQLVRKYAADISKNEVEIAVLDHGAVLNLNNVSQVFTVLLPYLGHIGVHPRFPRTITEPSVNLHYLFSFRRCVRMPLFGPDMVEIGLKSFFDHASFTNQENHRFNFMHKLPPSFPLRRETQ